KNLGAVTSLDSTGAVTLASADSGGNQGDGFAGSFNGSFSPSLAYDGSSGDILVAFFSDATNFRSDLVGSDPQPNQVFVKDLTTSSITLVSISSTGTEQGDLASANPFLAVDDSGNVLVA